MFSVLLWIAVKPWSITSRAAPVMLRVVRVESRMKQSAAAAVALCRPT